MTSGGPMWICSSPVLNILWYAERWHVILCSIFLGFILQYDICSLYPRLIGAVGSGEVVMAHGFPSKQQSRVLKQRERDVSLYVHQLDVLVNFYNYERVAEQEYKTNFFANFVKTRSLEYFFSQTKLILFYM